MSAFSLKTLQAECAAALIADPFFSTNLSNTYTPIPVLAESLADITFNLTRAFDELISSVCVLTPTATVLNPLLPGPYFERIDIVVEIVENPLNNQPAITANPYADDIAVAVAGILHQFQPGGLEECLYVTKIVPSSRGELSVRRVELVTQGGLAWPVPSLGAIDCSPAAGPGPATVILTLAAPVAGAVIFYSLDGSTPTPRNAWAPITGATSYLFQGPVNVSAGKLLRARAYLAGFLTSADLVVQF